MRGRPGQATWTRPIGLEESGVEIEIEVESVAEGGGWTCQWAVGGQSHLG